MNAGVVATVNWTMTLEMNAIWEFPMAEVLPDLLDERIPWFVDLADPAKRPVEDLRAAWIPSVACRNTPMSCSASMKWNSARLRRARHRLASRRRRSRFVGTGRAARSRPTGYRQGRCHLAARVPPRPTDRRMNGFFNPVPSSPPALATLQCGYVSAIRRLNEAQSLLVGTATGGNMSRLPSRPPGAISHLLARVAE